MTADGESERSRKIQEALRIKRALKARRRPEETPLPSRPTDAPAHLSPWQRGLWLAHRLAPLDPAYNVASAMRVDRTLDPERLARAFTRVVARHRILRTRFVPNADGAIGHVAAPPNLDAEEPLPRDLQPRSIQALPGQAREVAEEEARQPFDLTHGPPIRLRWIEGDETPLLVLVVHHLVADERSLDLLWEDLDRAYRNELPAGEAGAQYEDLAYLLRTKEEASRAALLEHWQTHLRPRPDPLSLESFAPPGVPEAAREHGGGGRMQRALLPPNLSAAVRDLAASIGSTPFAVWAFAFRVLLHRYAPEHRIAFATPIAQRSHPASAAMPGYFLNPVVLYASLDEELTVREGCERFAKVVANARTNGALPFERLAEALAAGEHDRHPIFQAMFVLRQTPRARTLGEARLEPESLDLRAAKFDLTLFISEPESHASESEVAIEYRPTRFADAPIRAMLGHYSELVSGLCHSPDTRLAHVRHIPAAEEKLLSTWAQGPALEDRAASTVCDRFAAQVSRDAHADAVLTADERWNYERLQNNARRLAAQLQATGVPPGSRVGLFLPRTPWAIAGVLGCHLAGCAYVPLDPSYPARRNAVVLQDARIEALLCTQALRELAPKGTWPTLVVDEPSEQTDAEARESRPLARPSDPAYLLYTSGSSGRPKGVVISHANLARSTQARGVVYEGRPQRFLLLPSLAFDSSVAGLFWTLTTGGALVLPDERTAGNPRLLAELVIAQGVTDLLCVPSLYAPLLRAGGRQLTTLRRVIVAGEACPASLVAEHRRLLPGATLYNEYGPTEGTVWASVARLAPPDPVDPAEPTHPSEASVSIGRPIPGMRLELCDPRGRRVPVGIPGEAWLIGPNVAAGYWNDEERTLERFGAWPPPGWDGPQAEPDGVRAYRTGDRMAWSASGQLRFLGRVDEQIKLRGLRIEPGEIESRLLECSGLREAVVVARPLQEDERGNTEPQLVAFVSGSGDLEPELLRDHLHSSLPNHMVPSRFVSLDTLPRLPNGKLDRGTLVERPLPALPTSNLAAQRERVLTQREQSLAAVCSGLLGRNVGLRDNLFELGAHSLLIVELANCIEQDFGAALSPAAIFQHPTVEELARHIGSERSTQASEPDHLFPIQPSGSGLPFVFCIPHFFSAMLAERFRDERPVYGLLGVSLRPEGTFGRWPSMEALGAELADEVAERFPDTPVILGGYSFGASMAFETARAMELRGLPVHALHLITPMALNLVRLGPFRFALEGLSQPLQELRSAERLALLARNLNPMSRTTWQRLWETCTVRAKRRALASLGRRRRNAGQALSEPTLQADVRVERFALHARYRPGTIGTPSVIYNAVEPATDAAATWRASFAGPLRVVPLPDPHLGEASTAAARTVLLETWQDLEQS